VTRTITNHLPHHPNPGMPKAFMTGSECIYILEDYLVYNMWNGFYVCIVQSRR
jgi:hypothetical protein